MCSQRAASASQHPGRAKGAGQKRLQGPPVVTMRYLHSLLLSSLLSPVWLFVTPRTVSRQAPLSMGSPRQGYWGGLLLPSPGDPPDPGLEAGSPVLAGGFFTSSRPELHSYTLYLLISHSLQSFPRGHMSPRTRWGGLFSVLWTPSSDSLCPASAGPEQSLPQGLLWSPVPRRDVGC